MIMNNLLNALAALAAILITAAVCRADDFEYCAESHYTQAPKICMDGYGCKNDTDKHLHSILKKQVIGDLKAFGYSTKEINELMPTYSYGWYQVSAVKLKGNPYKTQGRK